MNGVSLVVKASEKFFMEYVDPFLALLKKTGGELILITEKKPDIDIPFDFSVFNYSEGYGNFINYCISSTLGKKVIILEEGQALTEKIVESIKKFVMQDSCCNLACDYKIYLDSELENYLIQRDVIVYNRGITGFEEFDGLMIEDFSLLRANLNGIDKGIVRLLRDNSYCELYKWYTNFILKNNKANETMFYEILEKEKFSLNLQQRDKLEEIFLRNQLSNMYTEFLKMKKSIREDGKNCIRIINDKLKKMKKTDGNYVDKYFSYLVYDALIYKRDLLSMFSSLNEALTNNLLEYLFENREDFQGLLYDYLTGIDYNYLMARKRFKRIEEFIRYIENYLELSGDNSGSMENKEMIISIYRIYAALYVFLYREGRIEGVPGLYDYFSKIQYIYNSDYDIDIEESFLSLEKIRELPFFLELPARLYIQKLRKNYNMYSCVLSICMIVKDEEKNLERCLCSIKPLLDKGLSELIIVDTGSTDNSADICRRYTENIYYYKWSGHFSKARNYSISFASGKYIFILDADEEFEPSQLQALMEEFSGKDYEASNALTLKIKNFTNPEHSKYVISSQHLIFKNDGYFYYTGSIHNQPIFYTPVKNLDIALNHYGYIMTPELSERKFERTGTILKNELQKKPRNIYYRYQLSASCASFGDDMEALRQAKLSLRYIKENGMSVSASLQIYNNAVMIFMNNCCYKEAMEICDEVLRINSKSIDFIYYKAVCLLYAGSFSEAEKWFGAYLEVFKNLSNQDIISNDSPLYTLDLSNGAAGMILFCCYRLKKYEKVIEITKNLDTILQYTKYLNIIIDSYLRLREFDGFLEFYTKVKSHGGRELAEIMNSSMFRALVNTPPDIKKEFFNIISSSQIINDMPPILEAAFKVQIEDPIMRGSILTKGLNPGNMEVHIINLIVDELTGALNTGYNENSKDEQYLDALKQVILFMLRSTPYAASLKTNSIVKLLEIYVYSCTELLRVGNTTSFEAGEKEFIKSLTEAMDVICEGRYGDALKIIKMADAGFGGLTAAIKTLLNSLLPENPVELFKLARYCSNKYEYLYNKPQEIINLQDLQINNGFTKRSLEFFCFGRLAYPENYKPGSNVLELLKGNIQANKRSELRVLHGRIDIEKQMSLAVKELKKLGIHADELNYYPHFSSSCSDYAVDISIIESPEEIIKKTASAASKLIPEYDIFHFYYGASMMLDCSDLQLIRDLGKKVVMTFFRSDFGRGIGEDRARRRLEFLSKYVSHAVVHEMDLKSPLESFMQNVTIIPKMVDISKLTAKRIEQINPKPLIVHMPSLHEDKGTSHILRAVSELSIELNFDFEILDPADQILSELLINKADLVIDNILSPNYGITAIEYMAMGKPVINHISDEHGITYPEELPIISAGPRDLADKLKYILRNRDMLKEMGEKGIEYVKNYHDPGKLVNELLNIYKA